MIPRFLQGLRARLILALLLTSALSLAVVAVALLSPLESRLRTDRLDSLTASGVGAAPSFEDLSASELRKRGPALIRTLSRRTGAGVALLDAKARVLAGTDPDERVDYRFVARALDEQHVLRRVVDGTDGPEARVAVPLPPKPGGGLLLRAQLKETQTAAGVVRRALLKAVLAAFAVALVVGLALASGLARRLVRLRDTALRVADIGPTVEMQPDGARDEVGDLTRAFAAMQSRLREQESARRTFVSTASHELRTPLASLQLRLGMLKEDLGGQDPDASAAEREVSLAEAQTERLAMLAADLLDLSRIDAGVPLRREAVELGELSRAVIAEFGLRLEEERGKVELTAPAPCRALADPGAVARIVRILLDNALKFSPAGEPVEVAVDCHGVEASVSVVDRGPGVSASERESIFERFSRGRAAEEGGFGLGLAIARELARQMDGDVSVEEASHGARFTLTLPPARVPGP